MQASSSTSSAVQRLPALPQPDVAPPPAAAAAAAASVSPPAVSHTAAGVVGGGTTDAGATGSAATAPPANAASGVAAVGTSSVAAAAHTAATPEAAAGVVGVRATESAATAPTAAADAATSATGAPAAEAAAPAAATPALAGVTGAAAALLEEPPGDPVRSTNRRAAAGERVRSTTWSRCRCGGGRGERGLLCSACTWDHKERQATAIWRRGQAGSGPWRMPARPQAQAPPPCSTHLTRCAFWRGSRPPVLTSEAVLSLCCIGARLAQQQCAAALDWLTRCA